MADRGEGDRRIRVAVVYGGRSSEHGVSILSAGSVLGALDPARYEVVQVGITPSGGWMLTDAAPSTLALDGRTLPEVTDGTAVVLAPGSASASLVAAEPGAAVQALESVDVVFPVLHGRYGEDGTLQGLLEMAGVPYVGPGVLASAAAMDKEFTKRLLRGAGLSVGEYVVVRRERPVPLPAIEALGLPAFVKPARAGSSVGITRVTSWDQLDDALALAFEHDVKALVEAAVVGREVECGVLEDSSGEPEASLPAEIRFVSDEHEWYDFDAKYLDDVCEFDLPPDLPDDVIAAIRDTACQAFTALDCAGLARVDFFVTPAGEIVVNEVNTMPGFTPISMFPKMWAATGVDYPTVVDRLVQSALRHGPR